MTSPGRLMSPQLSFTSALQGATATTSHARGTISKTEADKALAQLGEHPHATAAERATIVQAFVDGAEGKALSPKARDSLLAFVAAQQAAPAGGQRADELKASAAKDARSAEDTLKAASARLAALLAEGKGLKGADLAPVQQALDGATNAVAAARQSLTGILQVADHTAKLASDQLQGAGSELAEASAGLARLAARKSPVTKKAVQQVQGWLENPLAELARARTELAGGGVGPQTKRYPSDHDDGGLPGIGDKPIPAVNPWGATGGVPPAVDPGNNPGVLGGSGGGDLGSVTFKYPSDNDGPTMTTMKFPSDHEDNGAGPAPGSMPPLGSVKPGRRDAMLKVLEDSEARGLQWRTSLPTGPRYESVLLKQEAHVDGFAFEAMIPVGAMTPTAQRQDPNTVDSFWVKRTGGIAGMTTFAGPFSLKSDVIG